MSAKTFTKLTTFLRGFLSEHLEEEDLDTVMTAWAEQKADVNKLVGAGSATTSTRKKKDPNAPKKACSSYLHFCAEERPNVKAENPDMGGADVLKELGARWKALPDKKKKKYEKLAAEDKARYDEEMKSYVPPEPTEEDEAPKKGKKGKKERTGPKRPLSSYMYFCADARDGVKSDNPEMKGKEITAELGRLWREELTDEQKAPYEEKAKEDKARYEREKAEMGDAAPAKATKAKEGKAKGGKAKGGKAKAAPKAAPKPKKGGRKKKEPEPEEEEVSEVEAEEVSDAEEEPEVVSEASEEEVSEEEEVVAPSPKKKRGGGSKKTGYMLYCQENRAELKKQHPKWKANKITEALAAAWRALEDEERDEYNERAADEPAAK